MEIKISFNSVSLRALSTTYCSPHCHPALLAAVQVNLDEGDGLVIVLMALLVDDKDVLLVLGRLPVQRRHAGVAARSRPYLEGLIFPRLALCHRPAQCHVNS